MSDESGNFDVRKLRSGGIWLPFALLAIVVSGAIAWGTTTNKVANLEQVQIDARAERQRSESDDRADRQRINDHLQSTDTNVTHLQDQLQYISDQLVTINAKLDRAEEERRR